MSKIESPASPAIAEAKEPVAPRRRSGSSAARAGRGARRAKEASGQPPSAAVEPASGRDEAVAMPELRATGARVQWVRQSCRLTAAEYAELTALKKRAAALARPMKRGQLLRAGLHALRGMGDAQLFALLDSVTPAGEGA